MFSAVEQIFRGKSGDRLQGGKVRSILSSSSRGNFAPQRFRAGGGKRHLPEVWIWWDKFERHDGLAITTGPHRYHLAFRFLPAVFVNEHERLANDHVGIQYRQTSMATHAERARLELEFLVVLGKTLDGQIREDRNSIGAAALDTAEVKGRHRSGNLSLTWICLDPLFISQRVGFQPARRHRRGFRWALPVSEAGAPLASTCGDIAAQVLGIE
jgi:hypothetical protein